jgi:hypothetical protein
MNPVWGPHGGKWRHVRQATSSGRWWRGRSLGGTSRAIGLGRSRRRPEPEDPGTQFIEAFFGWVLLAILVPSFSLILFAIAQAVFGPMSFPDAWGGVLFGCLSVYYWVHALLDLNVPVRVRLPLILFAVALHVLATGGAASVLA